MTGLQVLLAVLAGSFTTTVDTGTATLTPQGRAFRPELPGMQCVPATGGVLRPARIFFVPVPPGVQPVLDFSVDAVAPTGWDDIPWALVPSVEGSGMEMTEVNGSTSSVLPSDAVTMRVIPLAGTRVAMVTVDPFCFGDLSRYASRVSLSVSWPERGGGRPLAGSLLEGVAPEGSLWWRDRLRSPESPFWGKPWARIKVTETGFHAITGQQLEDAGCQVVGMPSESFSMLAGPGIPFVLEDCADEHLPTPVALSISDGDDGIFDTADTLFFYGSALVRAVVEGDSLAHTWHRYDDANTYWLTWGGSPGVRMETFDASLRGYPQWGPTTAHLVWLEQDYTWYVEEDRTGWCWSPIPQSSPSYIYFSPPPGSSGRTLRVSIMHTRNTGSGSDSLVLNGVTVVDSTFLNNRFMRLWAIDDPPLNQGMNTLKIWSSNTEGPSAFNYLEIELETLLAPDRQLFFLDRAAGSYTFEVPGAEPGARAFLTGSPFSPVELVNWSISDGFARLSIGTEPSGSAWIVNPGSYLQPASIEYAQPGRIVGTGLEGDVIVLFPESLMEFASAIEAVYAARGLTIVPASYSEVYDEFNQGVESPGAVRSFVRHALDHWANPPQALLLVGDSNHDPLGHTTGERPLSPLFRTIGGNDNKYGAGDGGFVTVHEGAIAPELPVSRLPVSSGAELQEYIDRLTDYERASADGAWANRVIMAADDEWNGFSISEAIHTLATEGFVNSVIPFSVDVEKMYLIDYPWPQGTSPDGVHPEKPQARADFVNAINQGCSMVVFYGHGSYNQIAQENLLSSLDVPGLVNLPRLPVVFFASCNTGQFDMLGAECFSEALVKHTQGGAVAAIGSSDASIGPQNTALLTVFLESVYGPQRMSVSKAMWIAKIEAHNYRNHYYNILGDGGVVPPMGDDSGTALEIPASGLLRGRLNSVEIGFPAQRTFQVSVSESGDSVVYVSPLSGVSIPWIRMGENAFRGVFETGPDGTFSLQFFMPVQADTGSLARAHAPGTNGSQQHVAWDQWFAVADSGGYSPDSIGPGISMRHVTAGLANLLVAELEDESGISIFGSSAGRAILLSIDSQGFDVSEFFQYLPGSHTRGVLTYTLPELAPGGHTLILAAWDGMGNGSLDTLEITITADGDQLLGGVAVFPNPCAGERAFMFETTEPGQVGVTVYTVTGRPVWHGIASHAGGTGQLVWNGRDADGDLPAAGAYIYMVTLETADGRRASDTGLLAVSPER